MARERRTRTNAGLINRGGCSRAGDGADETTITGNRKPLEQRLLQQGRLTFTVQIHRLKLKLVANVLPGKPADDHGPAVGSPRQFGNALGGSGFQDRPRVIAPDADNPNGCFCRGNERDLVAGPREGSSAGSCGYLTWRLVCKD